MSSAPTTAPAAPAGGAESGAVSANADDARRRYVVAHPGRGEAVSMTGEIFTFVVRNDDTAGAYALMQVVVAPGAGPPPHVHAEVEESFWVLEGELACTVDGETVRAPAGSYLNIPRGSVHNWHNPGTVNAKIMTLVVPGGMDNYFEEAGHPVTDPSAPPRPATPEDVRRVAALGPKYGITFVKPAGGAAPGGGGAT